MLPVVTSFLLAVLGVADGLSVAELRFVVAALPFVTLSAFCSAIAVWRYLPADRHATGPSRESQRRVSRTW